MMVTMNLSIRGSRRFGGDIGLLWSLPCTISRRQHRCTVSAIFFLVPTSAASYRVLSGSHVHVTMTMKKKKSASSPALAHHELTTAMAEVQCNTTHAVAVKKGKLGVGEDDKPGENAEAAVLLQRMDA